MPDDTNNLLENLIESTDKNSDENNALAEANLEQNTLNGDILEQQLEVQDRILEKVEDINSTKIELDFGDMNEAVATVRGKDGKDGRDGVDGKDGKDGKDGRHGIDGVNGKDGKNGEKGKTGAPGRDGKDGKNGKDGKDGKDGRNGKDGSPDTPEQVKQKLLEVGLKYEEIEDAPDIEQISRIARASKTVSLIELDDVDYSGLTQGQDGKYILGQNGDGSGDVVGPASATDSNFAAFDTTTGKLIKDSGVSSSDFATAAQGTLADSALQSSDIGSSIQAWDAHLDDIAALTPGAEGSMITSDGLGGYQISNATAVRGYLNVEDGADVTDATNVDAAGAVMESDYTPAHSMLVQQSGTGSPSILQVGTNTIIGRQSGGGSDIEDLSMSQVRTMLNVEDGADVTPALSKSITIESPTSSEDISMFFADYAVTVTQLNAVLRGSSTPSVTWTIRHNSDRSATGSEVVTSGTTTTSTTTGSEVTSFNDATIPAGSWVWLETTAQSGTVDELSVTVTYTVD